MPQPDQAGNANPEQDTQSTNGTNGTNGTQQTATTTESGSFEDIVRRSSEANPPQSKGEAEDISIDELKNVNFDDIRDPVARQVAQRRLKELESGFNKKYENVAKLRKDYEAKMEELGKRAEETSHWTPERLRSEINKQDFIQSAQALQQQSAPNNWEGSQEEWSALSTDEKRQFEKLNKDVLSIQNQLNQTRQAQEDEKLRGKYPDYEPKEIDSFAAKVQRGEYIPSREDAYKIISFERRLKQAYQLGLKDKNGNINEKVNAASPNGMNTTSPGDIPEDVKKGGFGAIARFRLSQLKGK